MPGLKRPHSATQDLAFAPNSNAQPIDVDPEDVPSEYSASDDEDSGSDSDAVNDSDGGREHYQPVSKSKLRSRESAALGPQYAGSRVRRQAIDDSNGEGAHDPFAGDYSSDGSGIDAEEVEGGVGFDTSGSEDDMVPKDEEDTDATSLTGASDEDDLHGDDDDVLNNIAPKSSANGTEAAINRSALRNIMNSEHSSVAASLNAANEADARKGRAVKRQRQTYDELLNARISLQRGLALSSAMRLGKQAQVQDKAYKGAEEAALNLWSTLNTLRSSLRPSNTNSRPLPTFTASPRTTTHDIWKHMSTQESAATPHRNAILTKWSQKTSTLAQSAQTQNKNRLTGGPANQATTFDILQTQHLAPTNMTRLVERSYRPQPSEAEDVNSTESNPPIYDDADFYATLLKDLIDSRNANSDAAPTDIFTDPAEALRAAQRAAKSRRPAVDTKASKGRKLKYTVHEKLQNFMAPEDRGRWGERQRKELFGSLLGVRAFDVKGHGDVNGPSDGSSLNGHEDGKEEEALRLFRS